MPPELAAELIEEAPREMAAALVEHMTTEKGVDVIEELESNIQADLIGDMDEQYAESILTEMPVKDAADVRRNTAFTKTTWTRSCSRKRAPADHDYRYGWVFLVLSLATFFMPLLV
jgi:Mg/Co/Ni transporter MgtE